MPQLRNEKVAFGAPGAQTRDVQFLFVDGTGRFIDEVRDRDHETGRITPSQGYRITSREKSNKFSLLKEISTDPRRASVLIHPELNGPDSRIDEVPGTEILVPAGGGRIPRVVEGIEVRHE